MFPTPTLQLYKWLRRTSNSHFRRRSLKRIDFPEVQTETDRLGRVTNSFRQRPTPWHRIVIRWLINEERKQSLGLTRNRVQCTRSIGVYDITFITRYADTQRGPSGANQPVSTVPIYVYTSRARTHSARVSMWSPVLVPTFALRAFYFHSRYIPDWSRGPGRSRLPTD